MEGGLAEIDVSETALLQAVVSYGILLSSRSPRRCQVAPSRLRSAGKGLFAVTDIPNGEVITFYPAHGIIQSVDKTPLTNGGGRVKYGSRIIDNRGFISELREPTEIERHVYNFRVRPDVDIIGYPDMTSCHMLLGHMANDGVKILSKNEDAREEQVYNRLAIKINNAGFSLSSCGSTVELRSMKAINAGEEILACYTYGFWVSSNRCTSR